MKIDIQGTKLQLTDVLREYAETRVRALEKLVQRYDKGGELLFSVELARTTAHHKQGVEVYYAEIMVKLPPKNLLRAEFKHEDLMAAIDGAKDVMKVELTKFKEMNTESKVRVSRREK